MPRQKEVLRHTSIGLALYNPAEEELLKKFRAETPLNLSGSLLAAMEAFLSLPNKEQQYFLKKYEDRTSVYQNGVYQQQGDY